MSIMEIRNIRKSFQGTPVLKDVSLTVEPGEVVAIIGPSGGGKSTLLRCATLLEQMDGGSLKYNDLTVCEQKEGHSHYGDNSVLQQARAQFGLVFQNYNLFPHYTTLKNITDALITVRKQTPQQAQKRAMELLKKMGLENRADAYPGQLSGGQQQRVAIARALAMDPDILFFDEPTSALDPELTAEILKVIRGLAEEKMTMVIVTHEMEFAKNVADRIVFMADGVIVEEGAAKELVEHPKNPRTQAFLSRLYD